MHNDDDIIRRIDEHELDDLLVKAKLMYDKLNVIALSLNMKLCGAMAGALASMLSIVGFSWIIVVGSIPPVRYGERIFDLEPVLLLISVILGALIIRLAYFLILERAYTLRVRNRLEHEIHEAQAIMSGGHMSASIG